MPVLDTVFSYSSTSTQRGLNGIRNIHCCDYFKTWKSSTIKTSRLRREDYRLLEIVLHGELSVAIATEGHLLEAQSPLTQHTWRHTGQQVISSSENPRKATIEEKRRRRKNLEKTASTQTFPYSRSGRACLSYDELGCSGFRLHPS